MVGDDSYKVIVSTSVGFALATAGVSLRLLSRRLCRKSLEANDYLIVVGYILKLGIDIASIMLLEYGIGRPITSLTPADLRKYLQVLYVGSFLYAPCIGFIKLSILSLYWVAFDFRYMHWTIVGIASVVVSWAIACCLVGLMACLPIHKAWDPLTPGVCINLHAYYFGLQIPNIITDFAILFLPFKAIWDLHLPPKKTLQLSLVMCIGGMTCAFSITRLVVLLRTSETGDITHNQVAASVWTDLEPSVAILAACLPIMRPLLRPSEFRRIHNQPPPAPGTETETYALDSHTSSEEHRRIDKGSHVRVPPWPVSD